MIDPITKLFFFHDDNATFVDYTDDAADYIRDEFSLQLVAAEDYVYLGLYKPFNAAYWELPTPNTVSNTFTLEYWDEDASAWTVLDLDDQTRGLTRSGYMFWDKTDMGETDVDSTTAYWVRLKPDADHTATTVRGCNLIFADDHQLKKEFFEIDNANLLPPGESSHIAHETSARNFIVQRLRNQGYIKTIEDSSNVNMTQWDLHDIFEIRQAAMFLTLSKIFFNLSDSVDDNWWQKYREYQAKFEEMFRFAELSFDKDDDGQVDVGENLATRVVTRWRR